MSTAKRGHAPEPPPAMARPPERQPVELVRLRVEAAAVAARRVLARRPGLDPEGAGARRVRAARSELLHARRELAAHVERIGAVECATAQEAAPLVATLWRAERALDEAGRLLRALGAALDRGKVTAGGSSAARGVASGPRLISGI